MLKRDHTLSLSTQARAPGFRVELRGTTFRLIASGAWTVAEATKLDTALKRLRVPIPPTPDFTGEMDIAGIAEIDTAGALLLQRTAAAWEAGRLAHPLRRSHRKLPHPHRGGAEARQCRAAEDQEDRRRPAAHRGRDQGADRRVVRRHPAHELPRRGDVGLRPHGHAALALPPQILRPSSRSRRLARRADHRADLLLDRRRGHAARRGAVEAVRRRALRRQHGRDPGAARGRHPAHRHHGRRPLRLRLHRRDRLDEDARGDRRHAHARHRSDGYAGAAARARAGRGAAAA